MEEEEEDEEEKEEGEERRIFSIAHVDESISVWVCVCVSYPWVQRCVCV